MLTPKAIHFDGAPGYTDAELTVASGLKIGQSYSPEQLNESAKILMQTGIFDTVGYKFDGTKLNYTVTLSEATYPIQLGNLPFESGETLEARLRDRVPIYHGKVPTEGTMLEEVRVAFERLLAGDGLHVHVGMEAVTDQATHEVSSVKFKIDSLPVRIGGVRLEGVSDGIRQQLQQVLTQTGTPFDSEKSASDLERRVASVYAAHGFAAVQVHVFRYGKAAIADGEIRVPFTVMVKEGQSYKLGDVKISPDLPIDKAEIDRLLGTRASYIPESTYVQNLAQLVAVRLKAEGYLDSKVNPQPQLDDSAGVVNYTVSADLGQVYHLGFVKFEGASEQLHALLMKSWQMLPGDPFDESYVAKFLVRAQQSSPELQQAMAGLKATYAIHPDPANHDVNISIRLEKQ